MVIYRPVVRHLLLFFITGILFSFFSYLFDLIMEWINDSDFLVNYGLDYFLYYILAYGIFTLPFSVFYNWSMDQIKKYNPSTITRFVIAIITGSMIGLMLGRSVISHYIGDYGSLKTLIVFILIFVSLEMIRESKAYQKFSTSQ